MLYTCRAFQHDRGSLLPLDLYSVTLSCDFIMIIMALCENHTNCIQGSVHIAAQDMTDWIAVTTDGF